MKQTSLTLTPAETEAVTACMLFAGLQDEALLRALSFYDAQRWHCRKGEYLLRLGEPLPRFGLVLSGRLQIFLDERSGERLIMSHVGPGRSFGESLSYLQAPESPVSAAALTDTELLLLSPRRIRRLNGNLHPEEQLLVHRFITRLAQRSLDMNSHVRILSQHTLQDKILALLNEYCPEAGETFTIPFDRSAMADYLGVDRSSLSRQLSNMRRGGILDYHKNRFTLQAPSGSLII